MVTFPGVSPGDPVRIWVNGQEFTSEIVSISMEFTYDGLAGPRTEVSMSVSPSPSRHNFEQDPAEEATASRHNFEQDPAEEATLCRDCGMWPEHHNHSGMNGPWGACVCQECVTSANQLRWC